MRHWSYILQDEYVYIYMSHFIASGILHYYYYFEYSGEQSTVRNRQNYVNGICQYAMLGTTKKLSETQKYKEKLELRCVEICKQMKQNQYS